jgi:predicted SAM-dependent methyltransferase
LKLNLGCGSQVPDGWINVDYSFGARFAKIPAFSYINDKVKLFNLDWDKRIFIHDLTKTFPWPDNSVDIIYSSHTLEHFSKEDGAKFISECHRVLKPSGIIRIIVPDLKYCIHNYLCGLIPADEFLKSLGVLYINDSNKIKNRLGPLFQFPHKCMYDTESLCKLLHSAGFEAHPKPPFESSIIDIQSIELEARTNNAVIVEGHKL